MRANMGNFDRFFRMLAVLAIGALYFAGVITGTLATVLLIIGAMFALTSLVGWCPLYFVFGMDTQGKSKAT